MAGASVRGSNLPTQARIDALAAQIAARLERLLDRIDGPPEPTQPITTWRLYAACAFTFNPAMKGEHSTMIEHRADQAALKRLCAGCPVTEECLDWARQIDARQGIWGGKVWGEKKRW